MRTIVYINPTAIHGGAEEALLKYMWCSNELGFRPVLIVPGIGWLTQQVEAVGIPYEIVPSLPDTMVTDNWRQQLGPWLPTSRAIAAIARKWNTTIIHCNSPRTTYHGGLAARFTGAATVTHVHNIISLPYTSAAKAKLLGRLSDWTLVPSKAVERAIVATAPQFESSIQTLYNGEDLTAYEGVHPADLHSLFAIPRHAIVLGNVGAMAPLKGQDILIDAFAILHARQPDTHLVLVGGSQGTKLQDDWQTHLRQKVATAGLSRAVTFTGWREDVWSYIKSFDIMVHVPTQPDSLPTVLLHAAALGIASIGSHMGGIPEIIQDQKTGLIVPPSDIAALSIALESLVMNPARRAAFGEAARKHYSERFSRIQMRDGLAMAYEQALRRRSGQ